MPSTRPLSYFGPAANSRRAFTGTVNPAAYSRTPLETSHDAKPALLVDRCEWRAYADYDDSIMEERLKIDYKKKKKKIRFRQTIGSLYSQWAAGPSVLAKSQPSSGPLWNSAEGEGGYG